MYKFDIMKFKFVGILAFCVGLVSFPSCDTDVEALEIQKLKTYDVFTTNYSSIFYKQ